MQTCWKAPNYRLHLDRSARWCVRFSVLFLSRSKGQRESTWANGCMQLESDKAKIQRHKAILDAGCEVLVCDPLPSKYISLEHLFGSMLTEDLPCHLCFLQNDGHVNKCCSSVEIIALLVVVRITQCKVRQLNGGRWRTCDFQHASIYSASVKQLCSVRTSRKQTNNW